MASRLSISSRESIWNERKESLRRARRVKGPKNVFSPIPSKNRPFDKPVVKDDRLDVHVRSPTTLARLDTPEHHRHTGKVRGSKYDVIPPVHHSAVSDDEDEWGDEGASEDEAPPLSSYAPPSHYQPAYPVVMYPMMMPMPHQPTPRHSKSRKEGEGSKPKKKVRYRNTPMYFDRDKTHHRGYHPASHKKQYIPNHRGLSTSEQPALARLDNDDSKQFDYISPQRSSRNYDPFDPRSNSVLARYTYPDTQQYDHPELRSLGSKAQYLHFLRADGFDRSFTDDFINDVLDEQFLPALAAEFAIEDGLYNDRHKELEHYVQGANKHIITEEVSEGILDEVVTECTTEAVRSVAQDLVTDHLVSATVRDVFTGLVEEIIEEEVPDLFKDVSTEVILEEVVEELIVAPEIDQIAKEVALDTCEKANNKFRKQEIRSLNRANGERQMDSLILDCLLASVSRQGHVGSETEHATRLQDDLILTVLIEQLLDVEHRRHQTVSCKPISRFHEKAVTDVGLEVLLDELGRSLKEDMGDLDEHEQGEHNPDLSRVPAGLQKLFSDR